MDCVVLLLVICGALVAIGWAGYAAGRRDGWAEGRIDGYRQGRREAGRPRRAPPRRLPTANED